LCLQVAAIIAAEPGVARAADIVLATPNAWQQLAGKI
jgi:hypothetical protein